MKCNRHLATALGLTGLITSLPAHAFISIRSSQSGAEVRWNEGSTLTFRTNTVNSSGMNESDIFSIFTTSLNRWKQAAAGAFGFVYYQGADVSKYPNYVGSPYDNSIFFTSNAGTSDQLQCGTIALTEVWYDPNSGIANKADLRFNDKCFTFTNNPADTISQTRIYLGDVATHELGHALGLDHSQNLQSSMIYTAALEMSKPSCDDQAAMVHLYNTSLRAATGALSGTIVDPSGSAVFGAHVQALELERGVALAGALTDRDGSYTISGLEPGNYAVVAEPYYPGAGALSDYYKSINSGLCSGGSSFQRTFQSSGGVLAAYAVTAGGNARANALTVSCSAPASLNAGQERSEASAPVLAAVALAAPVATQSVFSSTTDDHYYRLLGQSGRVSAVAQSYSLFARSDVQVELLDAAGNRLSQTADDNVFSSTASGYIDYDAGAYVDLASAQDLYVHVFTRAQVPSSRFPSGSVGVSSTPYYVLSVSRGQSAPVYAANARCEAFDAFGAYQNNGDAPAFADPNQSSTQSAGCGMLSNRDGDDDNDPMGPAGQVRLANFAGLAGLLLAARAWLRARGSSSRP